MHGVDTDNTENRWDQTMLNQMPPVAQGRTIKINSSEADTLLILRSYI